MSHLFLDESLGVAGASDKTRAMFRAVYGKANAVVRVRKGNGEEVFSESFDVRRGVVQGDIFSPLCFIIALARVMELHDTKLGGALAPSPIKEALVGRGQRASPRRRGGRIHLCASVRSRG